MAEDIQKACILAAKRLQSAERICALTGAGVSAESGVATFRGAGGVWEGYRVEEVATAAAFDKNPALVWRFYNSRRSRLREILPNPGHFALAELERRWRSDHFTLITQNVDGLHRAAGSQNILEIHGSIRRVRCVGCQRTEDRELEALPELPHCDACGAKLRPDVVWFFEILPPAVWMAAEEAARACDCFLLIGTSSVVYPAAGLTEVAQAHGASVIEVNPEPTARGAAVRLAGPSGELLPRLIQCLNGR